MAEITLKATTGRELGSGPSKRIRVEGKVPGVVYGLDADPIPVTVEWKPLREALTTDAGLNALIDLDVDGDVALTVVKELQRHPIRGNVLHIDFLRVSADAEITVEVPIVLEGEAKAVLSEGGTVDHLLYTLSINAKPADIPNELTVDISELEIGGCRPVCPPTSMARTLWSPVPRPPSRPSPSPPRATRLRVAKPLPPPRPAPRVTARADAPAGG
jgi:large subunit ribosomal protein L25